MKETKQTADTSKWKGMHMGVKKGKGLGKKIRKVDPIDSPQVSTSNGDS